MWRRSVPIALGIVAGSVLATGCASTQDVAPESYRLGDTANTLVLRLPVGGCDAVAAELQAQSPGVVTVGLVLDRNSGTCTAEMVLNETTVTLDEPLGERAVVDALGARIPNCADRVPMEFGC